MHAYLIMAHDCPQTLGALLRAIDDVRNDIFLHIDRRSALYARRSELHTERARLTLIASTAVYWGSYSQIDCELRLFAAARQSSHHDYYHLISGVDLPLHSQDFIHSFFSAHQGTEYIGFCPSDDAEATRRMRHRHVLSHHFRSPSLAMRIVRRLTQTAVDIVCHPNRDVSFRKGPNWVSVTETFTDYLLDNRQLVRSLFSHSRNGDEHYKQTLAALSPEIMARVNPVSEDNPQALREIDWRRGSPYTWRLSDIEQLRHSSLMFARKFSDEHIDVVRALCLSATG